MYANEVEDEELKTRRGELTEPVHNGNVALSPRCRRNWVHKQLRHNLTFTSRRAIPNEGKSACKVVSKCDYRLRETIAKSFCNIIRFKLRRKMYRLGGIRAPMLRKRKSRIYFCMYR